MQLSFAIVLLLSSLGAHALSADFWTQLEHERPSLVLFREISRIYRPSFEEEAIRRLVEEIVSEAKAKVWSGVGPSVERGGKRGNLLIRVPGRGKYATGFRPVILQAHLDMVIQATDAEALAQLKQYGIDIVETDGWMHSRRNRTTLGADNGAGVAQALRFVVRPLEDQMPLEILLTVEEEDGMGGAKDLGFDLKGGCLVNLDWDHVGQIGHACTGAAVIEAEGDVAIERLPEDQPLYAIEALLYGLPGGHSGIEIAKGLPNAAIYAAGVAREALDHRRRGAGRAARNHAQTQTRVRDVAPPRAKRSLRRR